MFKIGEVWKSFFAFDCYSIFPETKEDFNHFRDTTRIKRIPNNSPFTILSTDFKAAESFLFEKIEYSFENRYIVSILYDNERWWTVFTVNDMKNYNFEKII